MRSGSGEHRGRERCRLQELPPVTLRVADFMHNAVLREACSGRRVAVR
jgi:hypothetical protein